MKIKIHYQSQLIQEAELTSRGASLVVGRGHDCDIIIREDRGVSTRHFKVTRSRRGIQVEDLDSRNKLRFRDKVVENVHLRPGQRLEFSHCSLEVSTDSETAAGLTDPKNGYFIVETGQGKGRQFPIRDAMVIGKSEGEDMLTLPDRRISRRHAKVRFQGGQGIWIDDLSSRNGTLVNGSRLEPGRERLLKDGDRVFIGGTVLEFVDGQRRSPLHVVPKALAMVVTLVVAFGVYQGYQHIRPDAEGFIGEAKSLAMGGEFEAALLSLDKAIHARGYKHHQNEVSTLRQEFRVSKGFMPMWDKTKEHLDVLHWDDAYPLLGKLEETRTDDLIWVKNHQDVLAKAGEYKDGIDAIRKGENALSRIYSQHDMDVDPILKSLDARRSTTATNSTALVKIRNIAGSLHTKLENAQQAVQVVRTIFQRAEEERPKFSEMARELGALRLRGDLGVYRDDLRQALLLLRQGQLGIQKAKQLASERRLADAIQHPIRLPSAREVGLHDQLKQWRADLEVEMDSFRADLLNVQAAMQAEEVLAKNGRPAWGKIRSQQFQEALQCRALLGNIPERGRDKPHDVFDEVFGLRGFWTYLDEARNEIPFYNDPKISALEQSARWFRSVHVLEGKMSKIDCLKVGKAGEFLQQTRDQLAEKNAFLRDLIHGEKPAVTSNREAILKMGTILRLVNADPAAGEKVAEIQGWLETSINEHETFLKKQYAAFDRFQNKGPGRKILEAGIPGSRFVQIMWHELL